VIVNADITIFNVRVDADRLEAFTQTNINGVSLYAAYGTNGDGGQRKEKLTFKIRIPISADIEEGKSYVPEEEFKALTDDEVRKHWTLQKGCYIIRGHPEERIQNMEQLRAYPGGYITVKEYADNTSRGSAAIKHWRIGGM